MSFPFGWLSGPPPGRRPGTHLGLPRTARAPYRGTPEPVLASRWCFGSSLARLNPQDRGGNLEPRGSRFEGFWPSGALLVATAAPSAKNRCVWTPGRVRGPVLSGVWVGASRRKKNRGAKILGSFRPPGALSGPRGHQETTRDEKPAPGNGSGLPGTAY